MQPSMSMKKPDLISEAEKRGLEIDQNWTKEMILDSIMAHDLNNPGENNEHQEAEAPQDPKPVEKKKASRNSMTDHPKFDKFK